MCIFRNLREMLGPLITRVLEDKTLKISTNPVEIYKQWVNQLEFESGKSCGMPYDVTAEAAMEHEEVRKRLTRAITRLKQAATLFLTTICKSKRRIPYAMLFAAKVLYRALKKKFPQAQEKEILKIVGNLIYYRYINGAIVAPDACDIVDVKQASSMGAAADQQQALNNEQRKNLGSVAKLLQFAASKKGFGEESPHLAPLNAWIVDAHERMKAFFADCVLVPDLDDEFDVDQFSEATLIAKPVIYVTLSEIVDTHQLLLDHRFQVTPGELSFYPQGLMPLNVVERLKEDLKWRLNDLLRRDSIRWQQSSVGLNPAPLQLFSPQKNGSTHSSFESQSPSPSPQGDSSVQHPSSLPLHRKSAKNKFLTQRQRLFALLFSPKDA